MDELTHLLETLSLQRYKPAFAANDVDIAALRLLSEADLKELGLSLGHRRKLMAAVAVTGTMQDVDPGSADLAAAEAPAERRQLTVMFCDIVDSTALTGTLDPERMERLLHDYQDVCAGEIARLDGFTERFLGDGVLATSAIRGPARTRPSEPCGPAFASSTPSSGCPRRWAHRLPSGLALRVDWSSRVARCCGAARLSTPSSGRPSISLHVCKPARSRTPSL